MKIKFLGAARQVTGSCYFLEAGELCLLIDCGMYQEREYRKRNWAPFQIDPQKIDYIILTHSHLDHVGLIPKLVRDGFSGQILATSASIDLLKIVLLDSAKIQEEDAAYKKKRHKREGRKGPYPEVPLYTVQDVKASLPLFKAVSYDNLISLDNQVTVKFSDAGHILGSAMIEIEVSEKGISQKIIFSGDIGQWDKPLVRDPSVFSQSDYVVMESTYGDRNHEDPEDVDKLFSKVINDTVAKGG
jgi:metallo-beta-lactamase family protein